ncbi:hypothetical protein ACE41H_16285 [Paenibacillus enshidis]|uniref:Uncharacterized protein n=1 Tax=Paenibacillus enshidis TaxID=1458439 RepID=A0ABV5AVS8_9BACL
MERTVYDKELGCEYTVIQTDNFTELYEKTVQINQGVSPSEVRRFQQVIKKLIVDSGKKGSLNTLLIAPEQLEELEKRIGDEKLVVALGDATYIFRTPDLISYVEDYIFNKNEIPTEIALRYVASQGNTAKIPFFRHVEMVDIDKTGLNAVEKEKIKQRIERYHDLNSCTSGINASYTIRMNSIEEILSCCYKEPKEQDIIAYNIHRLARDQIEAYIKRKIEVAKEIGAGSLSTSMRRLLLAFDYICSN